MGGRSLPNGHSQDLRTFSYAQYAVDRNGRVCVRNIISRLEVSDEKRQNREELFLCQLLLDKSNLSKMTKSAAYLISERQQETDCIDLQNRVYGVWSSLQILEDVLGEKIHYIHSCIDRRHAKLTSS